MNGHRRNQAVEELKTALRQRPVRSFTEKEIFHPTGYAKRVMDSLRITSVQLRKVFQEFRTVMGKDKPNMPRLYKMYALLEYQEKRGVLDRDFKELMFELLNNLERNQSKENFDKAYDLLMAMVAYSKETRGGR